MKIFKKAFTLVEVLVVMAIIGVVGILAVSNARRDTDEAEKVSQLRKCYEIIDTAFATAVAETTSVDNWSWNNSSTYKVWNILKPYLKLTKDCEQYSGCFRPGKPINITSEWDTDIDSSNRYGKGILVTGASIAVAGCYNNCHDKGDREIDTIADDDIQWAEVIVDVNGPEKGPYKLGDDVFAFRIVRNGDVRPYANDYDSRYYRMADCINESGLLCTAWVIQFGNEDYLKYVDGKCPDGKTLSWDGNHSCRSKK